MNVIIERYITDQDMNEYNALIHRPRVSFQISEYIWNHIYANCLKSYQIIMDEFMYHINLWFILYDEKRNYETFNSPYNRKCTYFRPLSNFRTINKTHKQICIGICSEYINENISSSLYADLVYDMFCAQLTLLYQNIKDVELKRIKSTLDFDYINSFSYPAPFEEQKYIRDNGFIIRKDSSTKSYKVNVKEEYMKFWYNNATNKQINRP